jgi:hypothetical protein
VGVCNIGERDEFRKKRGIAEGLAHDRFAGPDGLMLLLSMIMEREPPAISQGFYLQCEISDVLRCPKYRTPVETSQC